MYLIRKSNHIRYVPKYPNIQLFVTEHQVQVWITPVASIGRRLRENSALWYNDLALTSEQSELVPISVKRPQVNTLLQRGSITCYAERCTSCSKSVRLSVRHTLTLCQYDSCYPNLQSTFLAANAMHPSGNGLSPLLGIYRSTEVPRSRGLHCMTLVSPWLTSARNSKGNIGSGGAEWERGMKNSNF